VLAYACPDMLTVMLTPEAAGCSARITHHQFGTTDPCRTHLSGHAVLDLRMNIAVLVTVSTRGGSVRKLRGDHSVGCTDRQL